MSVASNSIQRVEASPLPFNTVRTPGWLSIIILSLTLPSIPYGHAATNSPAGICYPVEGEAYAVSKSGLKTPIGTLTTLAEGDSLIVVSGSLTFIDLRLNQRPTYGAGTRLIIPPVKRPRPPRWWQRIKGLIARSITEPELRRIGGAVRATSSSIWPDSIAFAPGIPVILQWQGLRPTPAWLVIHALDDSARIDLGPVTAANGRRKWKPPISWVGVKLDWVLHSELGEPVRSGTFEILSEDEAEERRERFRQTASQMSVDGDVDFLAAIVAAVDRCILW